MKSSTAGFKLKPIANSAAFPNFKKTPKLPARNNYASEISASMSAAIKLSSPATREFWEIPVLLEDDHLLALDKPAGLLTSPDPSTPERPSLLEMLHAGIAAGKPWATARNLVYLNIPHRLDPDTT